MANRSKTLRPAVAPELRDWVDLRLLSAHIRIVRTMVLGIMLNALLVAWSVWSAVPLIETALYLGSSIFAAGHRLFLAEGVSRVRRRKRTVRMIAAVRANSLWMGLNLGLPLFLWLPVVPQQVQLLLVVAGATQIASAAYTVRTLPWSATLYILLQALGMCLGLARIGGPAAYGAIAIMAVASGLLVRMAFTAHDLFITRIMADRELAASTRTVKLLLNEYEESGSDWLYELDNMGCLVGVSRRFAAAAGEPASALEGRHFPSIFADGHNREMLAGLVADRRAFRDEVLPLRVPGGGEPQRWWSVSGRPTYTSGGERVAFRGVIADVTEQHLAESRAHHMAHYDALTGLPNRALFNVTLAEMLDDRDDEVVVAMLLVDVDHFKVANEMYGHPVGDAFLRLLAQRMAEVIETTGLGGARHLIARLGGDEFAIILADHSAADYASRLALQLTEAMKDNIVVEGNELASSVSIGIALSPQHALLKQQLMSNADIALYFAKQAGPGSWEVFEPGMDSALNDRHSLTRDLRHAVSRGELRLYLQPLVSTADEQTTGYEALLRWQHPERGLIQPDVFVPLAEETGLIVQIGEWVIRTALAQAAAWPEALTVAINLSPVQLGSPNLLPVVVNALAETGVDPARVDFEITESVLLHNSDANIEVLKRLHDLGVKIALDDFGTGYASLNYLLTFPFDKIKIDRRFICDLATREESRAIVGAVIGLANELGMCTLAEGVEEYDQLVQLREQGCQMAQGWLFGRALPPEQYQPRSEHRSSARAPIEMPEMRPPAAGAKTYSRRARG